MQSTTPVRQDKDWFPASEWLKFHDAFLARKAAGPIDLLFIGDSITQGWAAEGKEIWDLEYAPLHAANFGIGGDETQHVLWRILNGEIDNISPRVVILKIGTNNIGNSGHTAEQTIAGITKVVETLKAKLPNSRILLLGVFPRDPKPGTEFRQAITTINHAIAKLADDTHITFLDIGEHFLDADGRLPPELMPDYLHLSPEGYQVWADEIRGSLRGLYNGDM
jgi:beta-glucosidase